MFSTSFEQIHSLKCIMQIFYALFMVLKVCVSHHIALCLNVHPTLDGFRSLGWLKMVFWVWMIFTAFECSLFFKITFKNSLFFQSKRIFPKQQYSSFFFSQCLFLISTSLCFLKPKYTLFLFWKYTSLLLYKWTFFLLWKHTLFLLYKWAFLLLWKNTLFLLF